MLEEYLRSAEKPPKSLREVPGLAEAAQHAGGAGNGLFGYNNQRETMRSTFAMLKNLPKPDPQANVVNPMALAGLPFMPAGKSFRDWMDFSLLRIMTKSPNIFSFPSMAAARPPTDSP